MTARLIVTALESIPACAARHMGRYGGKKGVYASLNLPANALQAALAKEEAGIQVVQILDFVADTQDGSGSHPGNSADMLVRIKEACGSETAYVVIDAVSSLYIYHTPETLASFLGELGSFTSEKGIDLIAICAHGGHEDFVNQYGSLFEDVREEK